MATHESGVIRERSTGVLLVAAFVSSTGLNLSCQRPQDNARRIDFRNDGETMKTLALGELTELAKPRRVEVFEPYEQENATFEALPLEDVLDAVYGPSWRERDAILFTCRDGYQPTIPTRRVQRHAAFLAISRSGGAGFTIDKVEQGARKRIDLRPYYVVWSNLTDDRIRIEGDYGWPYQVTGIDLVSFRSRFGDMIPKGKSSRSVLEGFEAFVVHCSRCHAINGRGGTIGPELNYPANPTEYMKIDWLRKWIDDPTDLRLAPRMPPLNQALPDRERIISDIISYLEAIAPHKIAPSNP